MKFVQFFKFILRFIALWVTLLVGFTSAHAGPQVPFEYGLGMEKYRQFCTECHGQWAKGSDKGPPLIHGYYRPSHHGDQSFYQAAQKGARQHHWNFGDMQPVTGITQQDVKNIILYIRWLQREAGIE